MGEKSAEKAEHAPLLLHVRKRPVLREGSRGRRGQGTPPIPRERACLRTGWKTAYKKCLATVGHAPPYPSARTSFLAEHAPPLLHARKRSVLHKRSKRISGAFAERLTPWNGTHTGFLEPHRRVRDVPSSKKGERSGGKAPCVQIERPKLPRDRTAGSILGNRRGSSEPRNYLSRGSVYALLRKRLSDRENALG